MQTMVHLFRETVQKYPQTPSFLMRVGRHFEGPSYEALQILVENFSLGLIHLGVRKGDRIVLLSDSNLEWIVSDLTLMHTGAISVPRGTDTTAYEMTYIIEHSGARACIVQDAANLRKLEDNDKIMRKLDFIIVLRGSFSSHHSQVYSLQSVMDKSRSATKQEILELQHRVDTVTEGDVVSITYTAGITGEPKGVVFTHKNFLIQVKDIPDLFNLSPQDRFISLLPSWHIFGRVVDHYMMISRGCPVYYTNKKNLSEDLHLIQPTIIAAVPRVWEGIYNRVISQVYRYSRFRRAFFWYGIRFTEFYQRFCRIQSDNDLLFIKPNRLIRVLQKVVANLLVAFLYFPKKIMQLQFRSIRSALGGKVRVAISGGSALPRHLDNFFAALSIPLCEGYGLTESTAVVAHRFPKNKLTNRAMLIPGTVGPIVPHCEIKIVNKNNEDVTHSGEPGIIYLRGPMIMQGYWKNQSATEAVLDADGWLNTGDIGRMTIWGALAIVGRDKDTIVLLSGENVEPQPLEQALRKCNFIERVIIVGQDKKSLGALIVPIKTNLSAWADAEKIPKMPYKELLHHPQVRQHFKQILLEKLSYQDGFKEFEQVHYFYLLDKNFQPGEELTDTLKLKRNFIAQKYANEIEAMYNMI